MVFMMRSMVVVVSMEEVVMVVPVVLPVPMVVSMVSPSIVIVMMSPSIVIVMMPPISIVLIIVLIVVIIMVIIVVDVVVLSVVWGIVMCCVWVNNGLSVLWLFFLLSWLGSWLLVLLFGRLFSLLCILSINISFAIERNTIHLLSKEDLREGKTKRMSKLIVVLVLPLGHGIHELVIDILSIDDEVMVNVEDEVPWVSESL